MSENVYDPYLSIFSVIGFDLCWTNEENKDCCAYGLDFVEYTANVINQEGAVYTVESEFGDESYTGTKEELIEINNDVGDIFYGRNIMDTMYVFQGKISADDPSSDEGETLKWYTEYFFDNEEEAEADFKKDLENAKSHF